MALVLVQAMALALVRAMAQVLARALVKVMAVNQEHRHLGLNDLSRRSNANDPCPSIPAGLVGLYESLDIRRRDYDTWFHLDLDE